MEEGGGGVIRNMIGVSLLSEGLELGYVRKRTHDRVACVWRREGRGGKRGGRGDRKEELVVMLHLGGGWGRRD